MSQPGPSNRSQLHRHAVHAFEDLLDVLKHHGIDKNDTRVASMFHHLRHAVWRSGVEVPRDERVYIDQGKTELQYG
jgi:hypothetical protein